MSVCSIARSDSVKLSVKMFDESLTWLRATGCCKWATTRNQMSMRWQRDIGSCRSISATPKVTKCTLLKPEVLSASMGHGLSFVAASQRWLKAKDDHGSW